ncbi:hypothetical protein ACFP3U_30485 [Kitasatospora misakiensis]|uniref:Uncharacterized protein n=1 Tax=Kitasatospora misakiensis TaxID=67330 RepID=A0ABW0XC40_9ACTN
MPQRKPDPDGAEEGRRRIDLSATQVAASALATVVGAVLASELGVYGTILGAAVVSVGATTGGAVFQHLFRRTGEQLRGAVDRAAGPGPLANGLRQAPRPDHADAGPSESGPPGTAEWSTPRVVRARRRWTWKSYAAVSALVFAVAMVPILAFELATGQPVSATVQGGSGSGTSLGGRVDRKPPVPPGEAPSSGPAAVPSPSAGRDAGASGRPSPGARPGTDVGGPTASPSAGASTGASAGSGAGGTPSGTPATPPTARPSGEPSGSATPSRPSGEGTASAGPSGGATPKPPAPTTAVAPPPAPEPAATP